MLKKRGGEYLMELNNPMLDWKAFGRWLDGNKGTLSNREIARRVGLSPTQVGNIIAGTSRTGTEMVVSLAQAIGRQQSEAFMVLGAEKPTMSMEEVELLSALRSVPPARKAEFVGLTKAHAQILAAS
jgi:plasmid maintenance system antidote protein VapI